MFVSVLTCVICFIDPLGETVTWDDSFSYARMVRHLMATGEHQLDSWTAANMGVQILFAADLAKFFGFSLGVLRISTLVLFAAGLAAFYRLLRDFESTDRNATLLTLGLLCSPPVLLRSFSFMTDVQFMSWVIIAIWLIARAIQRMSPALKPDRAVPVRRTLRAARREVAAYLCEIEPRQLSCWWRQTQSSPVVRWAPSAGMASVSLSSVTCLGKSASIIS
jgi:hypothetical protein